MTSDSCVLVLASCTRNCGIEGARKNKQDYFGRVEDTSTIGTIQ